MHLVHDVTFSGFYNRNLYRERVMFLRISLVRDVREESMHQRSIKVWVVRSVMVVVIMMFLVVFCLVVGGCGDSEGDVELTSSFQGAVEIVEAPQEFIDDDLESSLSGGEPRRGGVFRFFSGNRLIPDPAVGETWRLYGEVYSGLTKLTDNPNAPVEMDLAEKYSVVQSGLEYEFLLRPDLKFSDGSPLTASDVKWSWERALLPETKSRKALSILGGIAGAREVSEGKSAGLRGVVVVDDRTLQVTLDAPLPTFLAQLADHEAAVLKRQNVEQWTIDWSNPDRFSADEHGRFELPVGTGPFKIVKFNYADGSCVLGRNEHYHGRSAYLDGVEFVTDLIDSDWDTFLDNLHGAFQRDEIDMALTHPSVLKQHREDPSSIDGTIELIEYGEAVHFLAFNSGLEPYDDVHVRRALVASADVGSLGFEDVAGSLLWPTFPGYSEANDISRFSVENAKSEFEQSRYSDSPGDVELTYRGDIGHFKTEYDGIVEDWRGTLGIETRHELVSTSALERAHDEGSLEMIYRRHSPEFHDPYSVLSVVPRIFGGSEQSAEYLEASRILEQAATESDIARRTELYSEVDGYILDQALVLPIRWSVSGESAHLKPWVHGYTIPKYGGSRFKDVWFDETAPKRDLP